MTIAILIERTIFNRYQTSENFILRKAAVKLLHVHADRCHSLYTFAASYFCLKYMTHLDR